MLFLYFFIIICKKITPLFVWSNLILFYWFLCRSSCFSRIYCRCTFILIYYNYCSSNITFWQIKFFYLFYFSSQNFYCLLGIVYFFFCI